MHDIQGEKDSRGVALERVGLRGFRQPIEVMDRRNAKQATTAVIDVSVDLPSDSRGTHMSRFVEVLNEHRGEFTMHTIPTILERLCSRLDANRAFLEVRFTYFAERCAPVSGASALMDYECGFKGSLDAGTSDFSQEVSVPLTSLCPCSKAISDYGAHNQRGTLRLDVRPALAPTGQPELIWIEELVELAEQCGSAPLYPLLKREDERFVTMQAYDNPVFVEDMVRNAAVRLREDPRVGQFQVEAVNEESIHNHSVFATAFWTRGSPAT